jgi:hypothetical protein
MLTTKTLGPVGVPAAFLEAFLLAPAFVNPGDAALLAAPSLLTTLLALGDGDFFADTFDLLRPSADFLLTFLGGIFPFSSRDIDNRSVGGTPPTQPNPMTKIKTNIADAISMSGVPVQASGHRLQSDSERHRPN